MSLEESGHFLRERRIALGLTLKDVQYSTKIRSQYLEALEEAQPTVLPPAPYTKGIIRKYCEELHLDPTPVLEAYSAWLQENEEPLTDGLRKTPGSRGITLRATGGSKVGWAFGLLLVIALIVVGVIYYYNVLPDLPRNGAEDPDSGAVADNGEGAEEPPSDAEDPGPEEDETGDEPEPRPEVVGVPEGNNIYYRVSGVEQLSVTLRTGESCWIRVTIDDGEPADSTLSAGATRSWNAEEGITIRAGNPADLSITVNDMDAGTVRADAPRNLVFELDESG